MFDNTKPNIILLSDLTDIVTLPKTLGIYKVAHVLRQAGFEVAVVNHLNVFSLEEISYTLRHMISPKTLFVGVNNFYYADTGNIFLREDSGIDLSMLAPGSILPHGWKYNSWFKNIMRDCNPNCKLVLGGPTARDAEHNKIFDYVILGYAECSIVNLAQNLCDPKIQLENTRKSIWGFTIIDDSKASGYDFSKASMRYADHDVIMPGETLVLEVARGCIFRCAFCGYPMNGKKKLDFIRHKDLIRSELIDNWERFGVTRYMFCDDTVNDSREKCQMIYEISQSLPFKLEWWGYLRLDLIAAHPETAKFLFDGGCRSAFFGIETLNEKTGQIIGKGGNRQKLIATLQKLKQSYGNSVSLHGSFIFGLPHESMISMQATKEFLFDPDCPLDTWQAMPLSIKTNLNYSDNLFISDIDKNPEKYGYSTLGTKQNSGLFTSSYKHQHEQMIWANQHTNRLEMEDMVNDIYKLSSAKKINRIHGRTAFYVAGLDLDLSLFVNKLEQDIDFYKIDKLKYRRAGLYKQQLWQQCNVPARANKIEHGQTFSNWLKQKKNLEVDQV